MDNLLYKYKPFEDVGFWIALVLGGSAVPFGFFLGGWEFLSPPAILNLLFFVSWTGWIYFVKGRKWSVVVGLFFAIIIMAIAYYPVHTVYNKKQTEEFEIEQKEITKKALLHFFEEQERLKQQE